MATDKQKAADRKLHDSGTVTADDLDLTTEEGLAAYPHKMANVTRGDLLIAMQGGSGTSGIEALQERWNKADHGTPFENEEHLAIGDRASQGKATQVQGARHADTLADARGEQRAPRPAGVGSVNKADIGKSYDAKGHEEHEGKSGGRS